MSIQHPSEDTLLQHVTGLWPSRTVSEHLDACAECAHVAMEMGELADLRRAERLPEPSADEAQAMRAALRRLQPAARPAHSTGRTALFGGLTAALGGVFGHGSFAQPALVLGNDGENPDVRTPPAHASEATQAHDEHHASPQEEQMNATAPHATPDDHGKTSWSSPFDIAFGGSETSSPFTEPDPVIGTPDKDARDWAGQQHHADTCAIRCQEYIITQFTGQDPGENALVREAHDHGWYHEGGGTSVEDVGNLLEAHGIGTNRYQHASVFHLANELALGHKVIVGVHSDALWQQHPILDDISGRLGLNHADHAVVVSGIDTSDPDHVQVIVSDPGTGQAVAHYPMDQFLHAWKDSDFFMVATQEPPPASAHLPEMAHFDYDAGHIDTVMGHSYDDFAALGASPGEWGEVLERLGQALAPHIPGMAGQAFEHLLDEPQHSHDDPTPADHFHQHSTPDWHDPHADAHHDAASPDDFWHRD